MRFCLTIGFLIDSRPCFFMSVFLLLASTTLRVAGARLLHKVHEHRQFKGLACETLTLTHQKVQRSPPLSSEEPFSKSALQGHTNFTSASSSHL